MTNAHYILDVRGRVSQQFGEIISLTYVVTGIEDFFDAHYSVLCMQPLERSQATSLKRLG